MSAILEHDELIAYSSGRAVCASHGLRICGKCCVDFSFLPSDEEEPDDGDDERVFVLGGAAARFMPQWDDEVLGPANTFRIEKDYNNPPKPTAPDQLQSHYCTECELTWLVGKEGLEAATGHPSHHTLYHEYQGTSRSLLVYIDGACPRNGLNATKSAIGVHFGPQSSHNHSQMLNDPDPTSQKAEITAAIEAMRYVRTVVVPRRKSLVQAASRGNSSHAIQKANKFRLILSTDSSYLVDCTCNHMNKWVFDKVGQVWKNGQGKVIQNGEGFRKIREEVESLSMVGIQVAWYQIPRRFNADADRLANQALNAVMDEKQIFNLVQPTSFTNPRIDKMWALIYCLAVISLVANVEALQVFSLPITKVELQSEAVRRIHKRHVSSPLLNKYPYFVVDLAIGTPPQRLQAQLDTGSSDLVVLTDVSDFCTANITACNIYGTYNANSSVTYEYFASDLSIAYLSGEGATGDYANDTVTVGSATLDNYYFGIMYNSTVSTSILGVSFDRLEFGAYLDPPRFYRNFPLALVDTGYIPSAAFSLYLNNIQDQSAGGSIIFGGIDTEKYCGPLVKVPLVAGSFLGITEYTVDLQGVSGTRDGKPVVFPAGAASLGPTLLDSGTSLVILPDDLANEILTFLNATLKPGDILPKVSCNVMMEDISFNFKFDAITINVPITQVVGIPDENNLCFVGISPGSVFGDSSTTLLGDTFLSSAYTVFDIDNKNIYLAQAKFNAARENIVQIEAGVNGVPQPNGGCDGNPVTSTTTQSTTRTTTRTTTRSTTRITTRTTTRSTTRSSTRSTTRTTTRTATRTTTRTTTRPTSRATTKCTVKPTPKPTTTRKTATNTVPKCYRNNCYHALAREKATAVKLCSQLKKGSKTCSTPSRIASACNGKKSQILSACSCLPTVSNYHP
ncbi:hypothetical protein H072_1003 [Dactylellina haptotyla CBS 200.50]|uniref:Peptidase A1 domain-containing protein n=1 Tax=Dactylellina haptotyla (strain CBS 200.50) TaxID=1284197 RepID=S8AQ26_DACHA|nr:hypothetical protein H072_1003 [Dactylellina haptotyla CBS 200.50]